MANVKSAIKRARQNDKRRARNEALRTATKTSTRKVVEAITGAKTRDEALAALSLGQKAIFKAVSKGVIPKLRASRKISRLANLVMKRFSEARA